MKQVLYLAKRLGYSSLIVWGVLTLTFLFLHLAPGDPTSIYLRPDIEPQVLVNIRHQFGFDKPLWQQYIFWLTEFVSGNFGYSFSHQRPVWELFKEAIPNTLQLTICVFFIQFIVGIFLGTTSARHQDSWLDKSINSILLFLFSMPGFWLALLCVLLFCLKLGWFPSGQMTSMRIFENNFQMLLDRLWHMILPIAVLSVPFMAYTTRFVRGNVLDISNQRFIQSARAFGLSEKKILYTYILRNAWLPLITLGGMYLPFLIGGAVVIEYVFSWPGMGRLTVDAIYSHDYPLILASNFIAALLVVSGNLLADFGYKFVDPRIRDNEGL